jgi:hypothetical protein
MKKKLMTVLGTLSLVACGGSGVPWDGDGASGDEGWGSPTAGTSSASGGTLALGGSGISDGGHEAGEIGQGGAVEIGGYGGTGPVGGYESGGTGQGGAVEIGGYGGTGIPMGGYESGGTGSHGEPCLQNVVHCFDAAANCYQYSPWSDCDQIVDICAAMQMDCSE